MPRVHVTAQEDICQIVLPGDEPPCVQPGRRRRDGSRPHLCVPHHKEYGRLTKEYKETSSKARLLYKRVCPLLQDLHLGHLCKLADVDEALKATNRCIEVLSTEIRQRQEHHKRFFAQMDGGHQRWMRKLLSEVCEVEDIARQLHQQKTALVEEQQRIAEETALAEEKRIADERTAEMRVAEEQRLAEERHLAVERRHAHAEERRIAEEKKRLTDQKRAAAPMRQLDIEKHHAEERRLAESRAMQRWYAERDRTETLKRLTQERQATADRELAEKLHAEEECLAQEKRFAEERREWEAANRGSRCALSTDSRVFPSRSLHYDRFINATTNPTPPNTTFLVCVAYRTHASKYGRVRCTEETSDATSPRCQEHKGEYDQTISDLRAAKDEHRTLSVNLHYIYSQQLRSIKACTLAQLSQRIADITRYLSLADTIKVLTTTVRRLEGYPQSNATDNAAGTIESRGLRGREGIEDLLAELQDAQWKLLRPERARASQSISATPAQPEYSQVVATEDRNPTTNQTTHRRNLPESEDEDTRRGGVKIATKIVRRVAAFFHLRRQ